MTDRSPSSSATKQRNEVGSRERAQRFAAMASLATLLVVSGCGYGGVPIGDGTTTPPPAVASDIGNWQVQATSTAGTSPFSALAGWIYEPKSTGTAAVATQSVFQVTPGASNCFVSATTLPSQGTLTGSTLVLNGFAVNGQYSTINATQDETAKHFTGTYSVRGGCAGGTAGTVAGTRYDALTGTYRGAIAGGQTFTIVTTQDPYPDGRGYFSLSGDTTVTGSSCLTGAKLDADASYAIGSSVLMSVVSTSGVRLNVKGTFTADAASIAVTSVDVTSGVCTESFGPGMLLRQ